MSLTRSYAQDSWLLSEEGKTILTVRETMANDEILVALDGALRSDMEHIFRDELVALMTVGKDVVLDCEKLTYIAGACQDALLYVQHMADSIRRGTLTLRHVPEDIYAEFERTNLHELLMIE